MWATFSFCYTMNWSPLLVRQDCFELAYTREELAAELRLFDEASLFHILSICIEIRWRGLGILFLFLFLLLFLSCLGTLDLIDFAAELMVASAVVVMVLLVFRVTVDS